MPIIRSLNRLYRCLCCTFLATVLCLHPVWADDTEIFFSPVSGAEAQPNLLFLLDASYSMLYYDCADGRKKWSPCNDGSENGNLHRLDRMNAALTRIINSVENVNIGLMRFSHTQAGGKVIYPVRDIEAQICDGMICDGNIGTATTVRSAKQELLDVLYSMKMQWRTPTVGGLVEAAKYYAGDELLYGKFRFKPELAHTRDEFGYHSRVSHRGSYTGEDPTRQEGCTDADLSDESCSDEFIGGTPVYISPIKNECQSNHLILVSDGAANADVEARNNAKALTGSTCPTYTNKNGQCAVEIADYLYATDLYGDSNDGTQTVTTHTIGFNLNSNWLKDIAIGEERYYEAESTDDLVNAINSIIDGVEKVDSTFVAPGITVDQFSRLSHRQDVYLALFKPSDKPMWQGNLKRYDIKGLELTDANNKAAVDSTGQFDTSSQSFWSDAVDGANISLGGAASNLPYYTDRKTVTYTGSDVELLSDANALSAGNTTLAILLATDDHQNVAPTGSASQSSISHNGAPSRAVDSNTSGIWGHGSVTHTNATASGLPWWQVALPQETAISKVVLHNRIDCCVDRLNNVHVFVSDTPFVGTDIAELTAQSVWHHYAAGVQGTTLELPTGATGRYVRVQLAQPGVLSLAEVEVFGISTNHWDEKNNILDWARGKDVKDADGDEIIDENRYHMGDPLHSRPVIVNYGAEVSSETADTATYESVVFVGTNEGYLHAIDANTGVEEFAFMPQMLIPNLETLYDNSNREAKVYGMDGDLTLWTNDSNNDGIIASDAGDHAYLYAGMRRGGNKYHALDVSTRANPKFLFSIPESDPGAFDELGQTWSKPILGKIRVGAGDVRKVLVFGGGYDPSQDDKDTRLPDTIGRAIYIVDATDGTLLWTGQPNAVTGHTTKIFADMQYSIPSDIKAVEDNDGLLSQLYVGDMGGQLWRFDINNDGTGGSQLVDGGVIADLAESNDPTAARRFFHTPDLSLTKDKRETVLNIGIGSGYRAHPLDKQIEDSFYLIKYPFEATGNYGMKSTTTNTDSTTSVTYKAITEFDLFDTTDNLIGQGEAHEVSYAQETLRSKEGWRITMKRSGEKILGPAATLDHVVRFISYVPSTGTHACEPNIGQSFYWKVNLNDGTPVEDDDDYEDSDDTGTDNPDDDDTLVKEDRWEEVPGGGLAPPVQTVFVATEDGITPIDVSGINVLDEGDSINLVRRWFWSEYPE